MMWTENGRLPALFIGHGSPMNAIEPSDFRRRWEELGRALNQPRAVLCISAHWETDGIALTASPHPETIHDFYGFPQALFDVQYPAPGDRGLVDRTRELLASESVRLDPRRGIDHGVWGVLIAMYPDADVPVVQLSLDRQRSPTAHLAVARKLAPLRDEGILVLGSGNIVHNLRARQFDDPVPADWAMRFDATVRQRITEGDSRAVADFESLDPDARLAVPTPEHYLPLLYPLALREPSEPIAFFNTQVMGALSMTSLIVGNVRG